MDNQIQNSIVSFIWGIADDCLRDVYGLTIPQGLDEVLENMILDYYIQEITYYYAENYL